MLTSHPSNQRRIGSHQAVDHISSLPDTILHHILSFVPTKSAVMTSILSKRWKYLWTSVPALDFTEMPLSVNNANLRKVRRFYFKKFVNRVLLLNDSSYLQHLRFHISEDLFLGDHDLLVKSWLDTVSRRKIREICVMLKLTTKAMPIPLPRGFLSNEKLVVLKLHGPFAFEVPVSFHLPNLKIMRLTNIQFPNDKFMKSLTLGCPVLKELLIMCCYGISVLYVESATLQTLTLWGIVKSSRLSESFVLVKAPNLGYLHVNDVVNHYDICVPSSLEEADLVLFDYEISFEDLTKFSPVRRLYLEAYDAVYSAVPLSVSAVQTFQNLTCLTLCCQSSILCMFLSCSPKLKSLVILFVVDFETVDYKLVPECLQGLENVELQAFYGRWEDVDFVEYFLKAGSILKKMKISCDCSWLEKCERDAHYQEVAQDLLELPRSSALCQVELSHRN